MTYAVIDSRREEGEYKRTWIKCKTLEQAKEYEAKLLEEGGEVDYTDIYVSYLEYRSVVKDLMKLKVDLERIKSICNNDTNDMLKFIEKEVLDDAI